MSTRRKFTNYAVIAMLIVMSALLWSCKADAPLQASNLSIHFLSEPEARTIKPDGLNLSVKTYDIVGSGPKGASFAMNGITANTVLLENLVPGAWSVTATGKNIDGIVIVKSAPTMITLSSKNASLTLELLQ